MLEDLINEDILKPKKKKIKIKASTLILVAIIILVLLCIGVIAAIVYFRGTILTIRVDGNNAEELKNILIIQENDKVYFPIKRIATYLQYDSYNGDYISKSEDKTKCYIENADELVSFTLNSNTLTKVIEEQTTQIKITEPIQEINGELCISSDGAQEAFNLIFYYNAEKNDITIQTLTYLYNAYSVAYQNAGYLPIEQETFLNKTAILDGMLIVKSSNNAYGVISIQNNQIILETKYDSIEYQKNTSDFLVTSGAKKGIIKANKETKIELIYDDIKTIVNKNEIFYIVNKSGLYGLLNGDGDVLMYPEYQQIGINNVAQYNQNGVTDGIILFNKIIPVQQNNKWGLFNIDGSKITDMTYDSIGCPNPSVTNVKAYGVLQIPDYNLIVVALGGKYNLVTQEGKNLFSNFILDKVYMTIAEGKGVYYITSGTTTSELMSLLAQNGVEKAKATE